MATSQGHAMKISWVVASDYQLDPAVDVEQIKSVGSIWGSWRTWRACNTDNVIGHDQAKSRELLDRAFQAVCNFYIPRGLYESLGRPLGIRLYDGNFEGEVDNIEDVVALHLAGAESDIVLMLGFDWQISEDLPDRFERHKITNRHGLIRSVIVARDRTQWVAIDCSKLDKNYQNLANLTCDSLENALQLLV
jgi:hypothetical protein